MLVKLFPLLIIGVSAFLYHVSSKIMGKTFERSIWQGLALTYLIAFLVSLIAAIVHRKDSFTEMLNLSSQHYFLSAILALGCVGIEGGFLLAYKSGWEVTKIYPFTSLIVSGTILAVGILVFKESLTLAGIFGFVMVMARIALMQWR